MIGRGSDPVLGQHVRITPSVELGPLRLPVRDKPAPRHALEALVSRIHLHDEALTVSLERAGNPIVIREQRTLNNADNS